jgi:hypothetical protein
MLAGKQTNPRRRLGRLRLARSLDGKRLHADKRPTLEQLAIRLGPTAAARLYKIAQPKSEKNHGMAPQLVFCGNVSAPGAV